MVHDLGRALQRAKHGFAELSLKASTVLAPSSCILYVEKIQTSTNRQLRERQCTCEGRSTPHQGKENTE